MEHVGHERYHGHVVNNSVLSKYAISSQSNVTNLRKPYFWLAFASCLLCIVTRYHIKYHEHIRQRPLSIIKVCTTKSKIRKVREWIIQNGRNTYMRHTVKEWIFPRLSVFAGFQKIRSIIISTKE